LSDEVGLFLFRSYSSEYVYLAISSEVSLWSQYVFTVVGGHVFTPSIRQMLTTTLTHVCPGHLTIEASQRSKSQKVHRMYLAMVCAVSVFVCQ